MNEMYYGGTIQNIISRNISLQFPHFGSVRGMGEVHRVCTDSIKRQICICAMRQLIIMFRLWIISPVIFLIAEDKVFAFLVETYGEDKLGILMNNIKTYGDVGPGFIETFKMNTEKLNEKWQTYLKNLLAGY